MRNVEFLLTDIDLSDSINNWDSTDIGMRGIMTLILSNPAKLLLKPRESIRREFSKEHKKWIDVLVPPTIRAAVQYEKRVVEKLGLDSSLYAQWYTMNHRCYNKNSDYYRNYGGRGIEVCIRWRRSFIQYCLDMGHKPSEKHSIDRKDNDGPYCPSNCRWATKKEQFDNRKRKPRLVLMVPLTIE